MTELTWVPEAYPPSGTIGAAGFSKLLGRPHLDPLTVLVRETAQNSWDARDGSGKPVQFAMDGRRLTRDEGAALRNSVFTSIEAIEGTAVRDVLANEHLTALFVSDRRTIGLGGPLLASTADPDGVYDWVDFVLIVGKANTQGMTGGTYGFGKTIAYVVSRAKSVVIHSRARYKGTIVTRLMACAVGDEFQLENKLYTGRHWWGVMENGASVPVEEYEAEELAIALGMPPFAPGEIGTNILILEPNFGGRSELEGMTFMAEAVVWNLWPKLLAVNESPAMEVSISWDGIRIPVPTPEERPPLNGFAQALRTLRSDDSVGESHVDEKLEIKSERPKTVMGDLAFVPMVVQDRAVVLDGHHPDDADPLSEARLITEARSHHIALIRAPELVVEYLAGPLLSEPHLEWAGVFRVRDDHDSTFARAEPPTHDSWRPDLLENRIERSLVKRALIGLRDAAETRWGEKKVERPSQAESTAVVARHLSHLVGTSSGSATTKGPGGQSGQSRNLAKVASISAGPVLLGNEVGTQATFLVTPATNSGRTLVDVSVGVALDDNGSDGGLDSALRLISGEFDGEVFDIAAKSTAFVLVSEKPVEVRFTAARSPDTSVMFDVRVDADADADGSSEA